MFIINVANLNYIMYYYNEIKEMNEITGIFKLHNVLLLSTEEVFDNLVDELFKLHNVLLLC